jgi:hypothetical protein
MHTGMLWFDNDPSTALAAKVQRAAEYYHRKYGVNPDTCVVNPAMLGERPLQAGKIAVRGSRSILPGHLWIGVTEKLPRAAD